MSIATPAASTRFIGGCPTRHTFTYKHDDTHPRRVVSDCSREPANSITLRSFLRAWVCVLTIVIPDDLEHAPTCDSPGEISARSVYFAVR